MSESRWSRAFAPFVALALLVAVGCDDGTDDQPQFFVSSGPGIGVAVDSFDEMRALVPFDLVEPPAIEGHPLFVVEAIMDDSPQIVYIYGGDPLTREAVAELIQSKGGGAAGPVPHSRVTVRTFESGRTHYRWSGCGDVFVLNVPSAYDENAAYRVVDQVNGTCPEA